MNLTKSKLKQLIKEELQKVLHEGPRPATGRAFLGWQTDKIYQFLKKSVTGGVQWVSHDERLMLKQLIIRAKQGDAMSRIALKSLAHDVTLQGDVAKGAKLSKHPISVEARKAVRKGSSSWARGAGEKGPRRGLTSQATGEAGRKKSPLRRSTGKSPRGTAMKLQGAPTAGASTLSKSVPLLFAAITINGLRKEMDNAYDDNGGGSEGVKAALQAGGDFAKSEGYDIITLRAPRDLFDYLKRVAIESYKIENKKEKLMRSVSPPPATYKQSASRPEKATALGQYQFQKPGM